jgi:hypothetical protein
MAVYRFPRDVSKSHFMRIGLVSFRNRGQVGFAQSASRLSFTNASQSTVDTINLYIPPTLEYNLGNSWEIAEFTFTGQFFEEARASAIDAGDVPGTVQSIGKGVYNIASTFFRQTAGDTLQSQIQRDIINPFKEPIYRGVEPRSFRFSHVLVPQNEGDCEEIVNIIKALRSHAAPRSVENNSRLTYPGEFVISFHSPNQSENRFLPKIGVCVCNSVGVNYSPDGIFSAYKNGHPVKVRLDLAFTEVEFITQQSIQEGF